MRLAAALGSIAAILVLASLIVCVWLDWMSATPTRLPVAIAVTWWAGTRLVKVLGP